MLRLFSQAILNAAGFVAALFISKDAVNFDLVKLGIVLLMIIIFGVGFWYIPTLFRRHRSN